MRGIVSSNKMTGVVAVTVSQIKIHPLYKKRLNRSKKFLASTPSKLNLGDEVEIKETRPQSRRVRFAVTQVINKAVVLPTLEEAETAKEKTPKAKKTLGEEKK